MAVLAKRDVFGEKWTISICKRDNFSYENEKNILAMRIYDRHNLFLYKKYTLKSIDAQIFTFLSVFLNWLSGGFNSW